MVLTRIGELEVSDISAHAFAADAVDKINRYERRVFSRRRKTLRALNKLSDC
jgi:hypothetical protein